MTETTFKRVDQGRGHYYMLNGRRIDAVTRLIGDGEPKPAIANWAARTVAEYVASNPEQVEGLRAMGHGPMVDALKAIPWQDRDDAAHRGTEIHTCAQRLAAGDEIEVPEELQGHVDAYLAFVEEWQPTEELTERPCLNRRHQYAGTFDLLCTLEEFGRVLIDLKTSRSGIFPGTALQLAAYRNAELYVDPHDGHLEPMPQIDETFGLWLRADGYDLHRVETGPEVFRSFLYVADVARNFIGVPRDAFVGPAIDARTRSAGRMLQAVE